MPELNVKAAHVQFTIMCLASELERVAIMADPEVKKAALCMHALAMLFLIVTRADFWLSES